MTTKTEPAPLKYDAPFQSAYDVVLTSLRVHAKNLPVATASAIATDVALKMRGIDEGYAPLLRRALPHISASPMTGGGAEKLEADILKVLA